MGKRTTTTYIHVYVGCGNVGLKTCHPTPQKRKYRTTYIWLHLDEIWEHIKTNQLGKTSEQWPSSNQIALCQWILSCAFLWLYIRSEQQIQSKAARTKRCERKAAGHWTCVAQAVSCGENINSISFNLAREPAPELALLWGRLSLSRESVAGC